jgi:hypothetical protein
MLAAQGAARELPAWTRLTPGLLPAVEPRRVELLQAALPVGLG